MRVALICGYKDKLLRRQFDTIFLRKTVLVVSMNRHLQILGHFDSTRHEFPSVEQELSSVLITLITFMPVLHELAYLYKSGVTIAHKSYISG